ncbi:MAG: hypothetical protein IPO21_00085 [Bacteroidales bacterium]|nr:hypothetical protein [Bacteroidales bacterium]
MTPASLATNGANLHAVNIVNFEISNTTIVSNWQNIDNSSNVTIGTNGILNLSAGIETSDVFIQNTGTLKLTDGATIDANTNIVVHNGGILLLGSITNNGNIIVEEGGRIQFIATDDRVLVNGTIIYSLSEAVDIADGSNDNIIDFGSANKGFEVNNGGFLKFTSPTGVHYTISQESNETEDNIEINVEGHVSLVNSSINYNNWTDAPVLAGTLEIVNGNMYQDGTALITIAATGKVYIRDTTSSDDTGGIPNTGYIICRYGGKDFVNNGILFAEGLKSSDGGDSDFTNNEVMFIKRFYTTLDNNHLVNTANVIDSDYGTIGSETGSYLFYCGSDGSLTDIVNFGTAFYNPDVLHSPGEGVEVTNYFSNEEECISFFYQKISQALPVSLLFFDTYYNNNAVEISWKTASEIDNDYFSVFESTDGFNFTHFQDINSLGNTSMGHFYKIIDNQIDNGNNYYKLTQTDLNGIETFLSIKTVFITEKEKYLISIANNTLTITPNESLLNSTVAIVSLKGECLEEFVLDEKNTYSFSSKGIFFVVIRDESFQTEKIAILVE